VNISDNQANMSKNLLSEDVIRAINQVIGERKCALHEPSFSGNEWLYLKDCLDSTFVSSVGKYVDRFEADLANYTGAKHAVAVVNGTSALHVGLKLVDVKSQDEVIMSPLTFVATANAVTYCGAVPHFVDIEETTLGIHARLLRDHLNKITSCLNGQCFNIKTGRVIRAILPMHTFGHPSDISSLLEVAADFNLAVVEDAAESLGSFYQGRHTGTFGKAGILSFNGNKTITTGGGGAILTDDPILAARAKHITTTAKIKHPWAFEHDEVGFNYRMPNINAALGCAQLEQLPNFLEAKRRLFGKYQDAFFGIPLISLMGEPKGSKSNYWLQTLILDASVELQRDEVIIETNKAGIMTRPAWNLMHQIEPYRNSPRGDLKNAESLARRIINIPSSPFLA
jgi:perosamine synthetase